MAEISAQLVKQLREMTGAGMMECKKALLKATAIWTKAEVVCASAGSPRAGKKEDRSTKQGLSRRTSRRTARSGVLGGSELRIRFRGAHRRFPGLVADIAEHIAETKPKHVRAEDVTEAERATSRSMRRFTSRSSPKIRTRPSANW